MAGTTRGTDPVGRLLVQVQDDLEHLKKKLTHANVQGSGETVDIQDLETAIQRTEHGLRKHTEDYLNYISCNPLTLLQDGTKEKYTPHLLKWGPQVDALKQAQKQMPSHVPDTREHAMGTVSHFSPGQQHKLSLSTRIVCNPENVAHRELLNQSLGISLPLITCRQKTSNKFDSDAQKDEETPSMHQVCITAYHMVPTALKRLETSWRSRTQEVPTEKIARGSTVGTLCVLPAAHRKDATLPPPPLQEKDTQKGIQSLLQRGLIPPGAHLTLIPPAILPQSLPLHSGRTQKATVSMQTTGRNHSTRAESCHTSESDQKTIISGDSHQSITLLPEDGMETPYPSTRHSVSAKVTQMHVTVTCKSQQNIASLTSEEPWALDISSAASGDCFTIYYGLINPESADFLAFKQRYCLNWGSFLTFLEALQKLLQDYVVPAAVVKGEMLKEAILDHELGMTPSVSKLLSVLENRSWVHKILSQPGQRYKGKDGRKAAAVRIQAAWRGYRDHKAYLTYCRQRWAAGVISIAWLLHVQRSRVRKMLKESRDQQLQNFRSRAKHLASNWNHIRTCRRSIIHIPSLGYTERQRAHTPDLHIQQNLQLGRLCDIADPNVDVIYVSSVELDDDTLLYYRKLLGLQAAVSSGNPQDACELHERFTILTPEAVRFFPNHHMCLSTLLKYSPKTLQRIRSLTQGREAYIVGGVSHVDDLAVADMLGIPILGTEPELAHLYSTKSGSKRIFESAGISTPPGEYDIYTQQQFLDALAQLITDNLSVTRWVFKVDDEFGGNGSAFCDIAKHLPCYGWALSECQRYGPDTWRQKWAQEKAVLRITQELPQVLEHHALPVNRRRFPTWGKFLQALVSRGGVIEAFPPAESITCLTVDLLISPNGEIQMVSCGDQIHSPGPLQCVGSSVPQCSVPADVLTDISDRIGEACRARGALGYLSVDLLSFIDTYSLEQKIWATDLDLCYSDQLAMTQLLLYLTSGTLDCTNSRLEVPLAPKKAERFRPRAQPVEIPPSSGRVAVLSSRLIHTNLSLVYYNVFFQMCRAHGIGYDVKEKQGTVFVLLENQKRHHLGILSIAEDLRGALTTFARNLFVIHQEISAPNMQGETNFREAVLEIEDILGVTEENKLKFNEESDGSPQLPSP
ncbi:IQ domain-containing protein H [Rhinophrynus dorsalis]